MELFRSQETNDLIFSSRISYEKEFEAWIHDDDSREFYMDDMELEHGLFDEVDPNDFEIYKEWCRREGMNPSHYTSLKIYMNCLDVYSNEYEYGGQY